MALLPFRDHIGLLNAGLLYLLLTLVASATYGRGVGLTTAFVTNLAVNFFFIEPVHRLTVAEFRHVIGLGVFLMVSVLGSSLLTSAQASALQARRRQAQAEVALGLSRALVGQTDPRAALDSLCAEVVRAFHAPGAAVLSRATTGWTLLASAGPESASRPATPEERSLAERAVAERTVLGAGGSGLSPGRSPRIVRYRTGRTARADTGSVILAPLHIGERTLGVLRIDGPLGDSPFREQPLDLLSAFAGEAALAVQRVELAQAAAHAEALRQADAMKTVLLTSISHDLKTPLAAIKASATSLLDTGVAWTDEDRAAFIETIDLQADRLNQVISDILDLNRIEAGTVRPLLRNVDARELCHEAVERTSTATSGRHVTVDGPAGVLVSTDPSLIIQALVNLIENAAKYSAPAGDIRLRISGQHDEVEVAVEDDGPGISAQDLPLVFERFYRGRQANGVRGSGLGLAVVRGLVNLCGGSVGVESSPAGTKFTMKLPAARKAPVSP